MKEHLEYITKYFKIIKGNANQLNKRTSSKMKDSLPLITSSAFNNGVSMFTKPLSQDTIFNNVLTINNSGSVGIVFYHPYKFIASGHVTVLKPYNITKFNKYVALYFKASIEKQRHRFTFGYSLSLYRLKNLKISVPINSKGHLDIKYMTKIIYPLVNNLKNSYPHYQVKRPKLISLQTEKWKFFKIKDIFKDITSGRHYPSYLRSPGKYPFICASSNNNGIKNFLSNNIGLNVHSNCISVNGTGSIDYAFYHPYKFINDRNVHILESSKLDEYVALFLCTCIQHQAPRYAYGYILKQKRLWNMKIKLPVSNDNIKCYKKSHNYKDLRPDFQFMKDYIKDMIKIHK